MSPRFRLLVSVLASFVAGCATDITIGTLEHDDPPDTSPAPLVPAPPATAPPALIAITDDALVVVDSDSGAVLGRSALARAEGGYELDAAWLAGADGGSAVVRSQVSVDELAGDLAAYPIEPSGALGVPARLGDVYGETSVLVTPFGVVVTQADMGERWRLLPAGGGFTPSVACGRPLSVRPIAVDATAARYEALSFWPEQALSSVDVEVAADRVVACTPRPIVGYGGASPSVRLVELGVGYARALADVADGDAVIAALDGYDVVSTATTPFGASRLEGALTFARGDGTTDLVLLGSDPARLAWVRVGLDGSGHVVIARADVVELGGDVARAERAPGRSLAVAGDRVFVATSAGLEAFVVDGAAGEIISEPPRFAGLRGPIATVTLP